MSASSALLRRGTARQRRRERAVAPSLWYVASACGVALLIGFCVSAGVWELAFLAVGLFLTILITVGHPALLLAFVILVVPLVGTRAAFSAPGVPDVTAYRVLVLWTIFVLTSRAARERSPRAELSAGSRAALTWQAVGVAVFLAATMVAALRTPDISSGVQPWFDQYLLPMTLLVLTSRIGWNTRQLRLVLGSAFISAAFWATIALVELIVGRSLFLPGGELPYALSYMAVPRSGGVFGAPSVLGTALGIAAVIALGLVLSAKLLPRGMAVAAAAIATAGVVMSATRASWIGFAVGALVLVSLGRGRRVRALAIAAAVVALAVYVMSVSVGSDSLSRRVEARDQVFNRIVPAATATRLMAQSPLLGHGYEGYAREYESALGPVAGISETWGYSVPTPHNTLLRTGVEAGVIGAAALLGIWVACGAGFRTLRRSRESEWMGSVGISVLVVYVVNAMAIDMVVTVYVNFIFYAVVGILLGAGMRSMHRTSVDSGPRRQ